MSPLDLNKKLVVAVIVAALVITAAIVLSNNQPISKNSNTGGNGTLVPNTTPVNQSTGTVVNTPIGRHLTVQVNESMSVRANP